MRIALFDFVVSPHSGPGACDLDVLQALCEEHEVTVFASELAMPSDQQEFVTHVAVPTVRGPSLAAFLLYFARACISYGRLRLRGTRFDLIQVTDCSFPTADVCYAHLCHRTFLSDIWPRVRPQPSLRRVHS